MMPEENEHPPSFGDRLFRFALENPSPFDFRISENFRELVSAYHLVYLEYFFRGYCKPKRSQVHYTYFCVLPESRTFLLIHRKRCQISGTVSLVKDSPCGLPMESLFDYELCSLRREERCLAEVTLLAIPETVSDHQIFQARNMDKLLTVFSFFRVLLQYALNSGITDLVIAVHPKHELIYRYLTFKPI